MFIFICVLCFVFIGYIFGKIDKEKEYYKGLTEGQSLRLHYYNAYEEQRRIFEKKFQIREKDDQLTCKRCGAVHFCSESGKNEK